jgi:thioredoxin 1
MNKLLLILLLPLNIFAQEFVSSGEFDNKVAKGITIIEFWAEWNKSNECSYLSQLNDCQVYKIDVLKHSNIQKKYKVFSLPTLIIFENGKEITRFASDITFKLPIDKKGVQKEIDKLIFNKFQ